MYDFFSEHGGVERIMLFQARALKKAGYDVQFAFAYIDENLKDELEGFKFIEYGKFFFKNETFQICSSLLRNSIINKFKETDLVICHSFPASYLALRIKRKLKIPYILHLHHPPQFLYNANLEWAKNSLKRKFSFAIGKILRNPLRKLDFYCVKNANDYILESKSVEKVIKNIYNLSGTIIYPTINEKFKAGNHNLKELSKYNINKDYILGSGRIIRQKRFDYLISASSRLKNKNFQLVLVGKYSQSEKNNLKVLAYEYNIEILFLGPLNIEELVKIYNLAKVTVLTCPKEWFGLVPIEAMACGCPVIAWKDNFGPQETIIEGKNGFLAEPYDIDDLAKKLESAIIKKWNKKSVSSYIIKFKEEKVAKELVKLVKKSVPCS